MEGSNNNLPKFIVLLFCLTKVIKFETKYIRLVEGYR